MRREVATFLALVAMATAIPSDTYSDSQLIDVVEVDVEKRTVDDRKFKINVFGEEVTLNLHRSKGFSPETLMVHFLDVDENGKRVIEDYSHKTGGAKDLYHDLETHASVMLDELDGSLKIEGHLLGEYIIEPEREDDSNAEPPIVPRSRKIRHKIYKTNVTHLLVPANDMLTEDEPLRFDEGFQRIDKRAIPAVIYPSFHAVVDYSHYRKLARSEAEVMNYVRILYHTAQVAHFSTMVNPRCQIALHGITVCKSDAACAKLNEGKFSYYKYKRAYNTIGYFAYQERYRTGTDYDVMFVTTTNQLCDAPDQCTHLGFANSPGTCKPFEDGYQNTHRTGMMIDNGAYDAFKAIGHEMGHSMNMPHDGDDNFPYARNCKSNYIMGQYAFSRNNWRYSSCSMYYLHLWLSKPESDCVKTPSSSNQINGWGNTYIGGRYISYADQCTATFGAGATPCESTSYVNNKVCEHLWCRRPGGHCEQHYYLPAAEGTACGPNAWCREGACVTLSG